MDHAARIKKAIKNRERSDAEWVAALRAAHADGLSLRAIAALAGVSHVRVLQLVRGQ